MKVLKFRAYTLLRMLAFDWFPLYPLTLMLSPTISKAAEATHSVQNLNRPMERGEQCAKSAVSTLSYPELPLPGYGLLLIPH
jgi:hypothetical protein